MFSSTVYPELKAIVLDKDTTKINRNNLAKKNESLGEASEATTEWMVLSERSPV